MPPRCNQTEKPKQKTKSRRVVLSLRKHPISPGWLEPDWQVKLRTEYHENANNVKWIGIIGRFHGMREEPLYFFPAPGTISLGSESTNPYCQPNLAFTDSPRVLPQVLQVTLSHDGEAI